MDRNELAKELVKIAKKLVGGRIYEFKNINGGLSRISFSSGSEAYDGAISIDLYTGGDGVGVEEKEETPEVKASLGKLSREVAEEAKKFDDAVGKIIDKYFERA